MVKIKDNIYCITTEHDGRKFNSYLIFGEKSALVDSCPEECADELIAKVYEKTDKIDYLIFTHTDRMRAGAIEKLTEQGDAKVIATVAGLRNLKEIANKELNEYPAKEGSVIELGGISLKIMIMPNLNWPDTMMLYIDESRVLLSGTMFVEYSNGVTAEEYCKREMLLFADFARTAVEKTTALNPEFICPSEGDMQKADVLEIYHKALSKEERPITAAVIYAGSENGYTAQLARTAAAAIEENGINVVFMNCNEDNRDEVVKVMNSADALCFASPTIHRNAVPAIMDVISRLDSVNMRHTPCMVTGSYGWGGEALGNISNYLKLLKMRVFEKPFGCIMKPSEEKIKELTDFAKRFAEFAEELYDNK